MGAALHIALDNPAMSREADNLEPVCEGLGLPSIHEFVNMSNDELADMLGDELDLPERAAPSLRITAMMRARFGIHWSSE